MIKIGFGYDVHAFAPNRKLWLGGIEIPHTEGLLGHSDADVLLHALCDALLGAACLRDIGYQFPDTAGEYKDIDSKILLRRTMELLREKNYTFGNADCTVCAQTPKLLNYIPLMQQCIANILGTDLENVSIKATTTEHLGFVGRKEGIAAFASVLVNKE